MSACPRCERPLVEQVTGTPVCIEHGSLNMRAAVEVRWRDPCFVPTRGQALVQLALALRDGRELDTRDVAIEYGVSQRTAQRWLAELAGVLPLRGRRGSWYMAGER